MCVVFKVVDWFLFGYFLYVDLLFRIWLFLYVFGGYVVMKVKNRFFFNFNIIYYIEIDFVEVLEN